MSIRFRAASAVALFCLLVYLPVCLNRYAFSDDYSMLIWLRLDDLKRIVDFAMSNGRPICIAAQGVAFRLAGGLDNLWVLRALSIAGAIGFAWLFMELLVDCGRLRRGHALLLALLMLCLPSSQIMVGWASLFTHWWPAMLAAVAVRLLLHRPIATRRSAVWRLAAVFVLMLLALLTYQPLAMMFFALLAIVLLCRSVSPQLRQPDADPPDYSWRRLLAGAATACLAMGVAYLLLRLYPLQTPRAGLETDWSHKLGYWSSHSLLLVFSLFKLHPHEVLGPSHGALAAGYLVAALACRALRPWHVAAIVLALPLSHLPSLLTDADMAPRRTLLPMALLALVLCYFGYVHLLLLAGRLRQRPSLPPWAAPVAGGVIAVLFGFAARQHVLDLVIRPQQREFAYVRDAIRQQAIVPGDRVYIIQCSREGYFMRADSMLEFGSPTNVHFWALPSMVLLAARDVWPQPFDPRRHWLIITYGYGPPENPHPHLKTIDMNGLGADRRRP